jgi:hypothetical protein
MDIIWPLKVIMHIVSFSAAGVEDGHLTREYPTLLECHAEQPVNHIFRDRSKIMYYCAVQGGA